MRKKPYFREESDRGELGNPPAMYLLKSLRPSMWFSAHLHVKFSAVVCHEVQQQLRPPPPPPPPAPSLKAMTSSQSPPLPPPLKSGDNELQQNQDKTLFPAVTRFLALDKVLPNRDFLQILSVPVSDKGKGIKKQVESDKNEDEKGYCLEYDIEWLTIIRKTHTLLHCTSRIVSMPSVFPNLTDQVEHE